MNLIRQSPTKQVASLFDKMFNETFYNDFFVTKFFPQFDEEISKSVTPFSNVYESDDDLNIELSIPGIKKQDISISVEGNVLSVVGKNESTKEESKKNALRKEFNYNEFSRSFTIPENVNVENINSKYENGILIINLPKFQKEEKKSNKKLIEVK